jgi:enoyl-CoA hydratase
MAPDDGGRVMAEGRDGGEIEIARQGGLVAVGLNRPRALNALTFDMIRGLDAGLRAWRDDPAVHAVVIKGAGERAFCAGGDIRRLYELLLREGAEAARAFYALEYPMNARLHHFPKPWIALLDGITMGGGVGISIHGSHRIATERTVLAMPETGIGLFPDVGATYVLARLPGAIGMYLGLTGARLGPADCLHAGLATHFVPAARLGELEAALAAADLSAGHAAVDRVLSGFVADPGPPGLPALRARIDAAFGAPSLEAVMERLAAEGDAFGQAQLEALRAKAPLSLAVTFRQLREGQKLDFDDAMRLEYRLVHRFMEGHDFREGVRALIVDKDNRPRWRPERLDQVSAAAVDACFAPLPDGELELSHD